jgi:hypothetical protein
MALSVGCPVRMAHAGNPDARAAGAALQATSTRCLERASKQACWINTAAVSSPRVVRKSDQSIQSAVQSGRQTDLRRRKNVFVHPENNRSATNQPALRVINHHVDDYISPAHVAA